MYLPPSRLLTLPPSPALAAEEAAANGLRNRLNTALTFDTLVEGTANRMARAAAMHVATMPGHLYNPLFIYGGVGLGKTHLMHAVGNKLLVDRPDAKVLYIHAEQFVSDVVKAYQRKTFDEFKERYHSLDLLLIDDVQFFANKDRTQEEFFNAFEALLAKKSHIVMTSDTYPKGLADIHERLVSRFDSGLTVAIEPPELEMRVAILINKARAESVEMPEEVAFFVAKNVRSNVRELEGALRKILAYSAASTRRKSRYSSRARRCATCCRSRTDRFRWKTSRRRWPTTTRSRSPTCTARSARPALRGRGRSRCTWPRSSRRRACPRSASCSAGAITPPCCMRCARFPASASR
jgi:chromosomal replication initiator protein DnaA